VENVVDRRGDPPVDREEEDVKPPTCKRGVGVRAQEGKAKKKCRGGGLAKRNHSE